MMFSNSPARIFRFILFILIVGSFLYCTPRKKMERQIQLPFPDNETARFYQSRIDSSEYEWYLNTKDVASSFVNEYNMVEGGYSATDAILIGEGIFHATVEVELPDRILVLELERPFKHLGRRSIWQVVAMKEKPWPKEK